ncbi:MAG: HAD-IA family hydrolase [Lachnospiraceae bacterium]|nr:HAD-IA family hydrolase [Lachnospiraceae bacterium]
MIGKRKEAFIWDLDGTLLDSYGEIVSSTVLACQEHGIFLDEKYVLDYSILKSGKELMEMECHKHGVAYEDLYQSYLRHHHAKTEEIAAAPNAEAILRALTEQGIPCFVFTHRGKSTMPVLKRLKLDSYFTEIITMEGAFPRKPAPDGNLYLVEKYGLDKEYTYFVGDRQLDMESAENAGLKKILYIPDYSVAKPSGREDYVISDFMEILEILK